MHKKLFCLMAGCAVVLLAASCQSGKKGAFIVNGTYENSDKLAAVAGPVSKVFLLEISFANRPPVLLDSARIPAGSGKFSLRARSARSQGIYEVVFGNNVIDIPLVNDSPAVMLNVDLGKRDDFYDVRGSEASAQLRELINIFGKKNFDAERRAITADSLRRAGAPDSALQAAVTQGDLAIQDLNTYLRQFINSSANPTVAAVALTLGSHSFTKGEFELMLADLLKKYPDNRVIRDLKLGSDQESEQLARQESQKPDWIGKQAPELSLPDVNGHPVSLSSFRGKYVLVDFWASWCGPCRQENPNVVKAHAEFSNKKNFAILGVSLDNDKNAWQQAIQEDSLFWTQVSDLKNWNSKAVSTFQFEGIPFNVLIDPKGKVIASALRGPELENKLREVLK
ncbi:MAG TPA: TlpA disulfide reductase family protein [Puia sp.]|nr:TlpA disulfide reductase family protein [Puia sp.]